MFLTSPDAGVTNIELGKHGKLHSRGTTKVARARADLPELRGPTPTLRRRIRNCEVKPVSATFSATLRIGGNVKFAAGVFMRSVDS